MATPPLQPGVALGAASSDLHRRPESTPPLLPGIPSPARCNDRDHPVGCSTASEFDKFNSTIIFFPSLLKLTPLLPLIGPYVQIYHEGKICLTVHFRRAHTGNGIGLASWWNQVYMEEVKATTEELAVAVTCSGNPPDRSTMPCPRVCSRTSICL
ncbi:hypothetical protein TRIUR3_32983 [Triticum urartu]|uniref:Uncharacterized protein n=1 Tax=Triticum urartu TaxID=4572 RepID=M8AIH2_TRIUA|nr:hypothetical protein TRIUR3_32983 [Triticum urartu]